MAASEDWNGTLALYRAAREVECAYYAEHIDPYVPEDLPVGPDRYAAVDAISTSVWDEAQRICDLRCDVEDALLVIPSPDLAAFANKVIICRDKGRDYNAFDEMLVSEAKRLIVTVIA